MSNPAASNLVERMALAEAAYRPIGELTAAVNNASRQAVGQWRLRWLGQSPGNLIFVCEHDRTGQRAVVVRGSVTQPLDKAFWIDWVEEDLRVLQQVPLPFAGPPAACRVAAGLLTAFNDVVRVRDASEGRTLIDYLRNRTGAGSPARPARPLLVVGHSLGGALASVLAAYLHELLCRPCAASGASVVPITFAAPTPGNPALADYLETLFGGFPDRYYNPLDMVAHTWDAPGLQWIIGSYHPAPKIPHWFKLTTEAVGCWLSHRHIEYAHPGPGVLLPEQPGDARSWFAEVGRQHAAATYLALCRTVAGDRGRDRPRERGRITA